MSPAHKNGASDKKEAAAKKDEDQPKGKTMPDADKSKAESGDTQPTNFGTRAAILFACLNHAAAAR
jgi:hypothetical protein